MNAYEQERYVRSYLRVADADERVRREAIAEWQSAGLRSRRRRIVAAIVAFLAAMIA